ncbi:hypothetical protein GALMADRAFT_143901 [Galerina marginata CBS 339.88]|uniref:Uncharacterized protein n=1 Tax=Galerina marginata (strain CBS 339.88) TaxID=685588 RepID=A0A067SY12_GALM3|nr:hypothetical protein GALMADRAFT_143901 [Galerina marginata CBS 339.88]
MRYITLSYSNIVDFKFLGASICCTLGTQLNAQVQHEIHISANGSLNTPISFDYLTYETSLAVPVADLLIFPNDSTLRNIEGWEVQRESVTSTGTGTDIELEVMVTTQPNANIIFDFYGVLFSNWEILIISYGFLLRSLILWFGFYNTTFSDSVVGRFTYSVDSAGAWNMGLEPLAVKTALNGSIEVVQVLLFQTFALPHGQHRLEVNYTSDGSQKCIPLTLTQLVVQNGTINPNSSAPTTTPTALAAQSARADGARLGIILGCCGAAVLALLILGIFFARRRVKRRQDRASSEVGPFILFEPFSYNPASAPVGTHQKGQRPSEVQQQGVVETAEVQVEAPPSYVAEQHDS